MPKYGVHSIVALRASAQASPRVQSLFQQHRGSALLGAIGPDLFFFSPEYEEFNAFMTLAHNLKLVKKAFGEVKEAIAEALEPVQRAIDEATQPIQETVTTIGDLLPLQCLSGLGGDVKDAASKFGDALKYTLFAGVEGGLDVVADAADMPTFSHKVFDQLFTPMHQGGKPERDWYWFDMLHYRNTGAFGRNLVALAKTDRQKAYALGYLTHIAADTVGHGYVNRIVGGPYRMHPQRHVVVENYIDAWKWAQEYGESVNATMARGLLDDMVADEVAKVDEYSGYLEGFSQELNDLLWNAFRATYPDWDEVNHVVPRPKWLSSQEIEETFRNFHITMSYLADSYVEPPKAMFDGVAEYLNDLLSQFQAPPSPPSIGDPGGFCLDWDCVKDFIDRIGEWMEYFSELAKWTLDTIKQAIDLLLELLCEATIAVVRAVFYLVEHLCWELYQKMHFILSLHGFVCPEPSYALEDQRGAALLTTAMSQDEIFVCKPIVTALPAAADCHFTYPHQHDCDSHPVKPPTSPVELPATPFPRVAPGDTPDWYIHHAPFDPSVIQAYASAATPADTRFLADPIEGKGLDLGNAISFAQWMIDEALAVAEGTSAWDADVVHCNWDLDADRGYGYKQWCTDLDPSSSACLDDERYLGEDLVRPPAAAISC